MNCSFNLEYHTLLCSMYYCMTDFYLICPAEAASTCIIKSYGCYKKLLSWCASRTAACYHTSISDIYSVRVCAAGLCVWLCRFVYVCIMCGYVKKNGLFGVLLLENLLLV